jgi:cell division protease FtsH
MSNLPPPPPPPPPGRGRGQQRPGERPGGQGDGLRRPGNWPRWSIWVIAGVILMALLLPGLWPDEEGQKITYTEFMTQVREGNVESIVVNNSTNTITGTLDDGTEFSTTGGGDRSLSEADEQVLRDEGVDIEFRTPGNNWFLSIAGLLLPVLLIIGFFVWMQRRAAGQMGNVMSIGRSRAKAYTTDKPSTTFSDIAGY